MKKTALHTKHIELGAKMSEFAGYEMPIQYEGINKEHLAVRNQVGLFDVSHMGEFSVKGKKAEDLIQRLTSNDVKRLENGNVQYTTLLRKDGTIVDDLLVYRWHREEFYLVVNAANIEKDWNYINEQNQEGAELKNLSEQISLLALQGPKAKDVLKKLTTIQLQHLPYYHFTNGKVANIEDVIISNTGYTGSGGYELYTKNEHAVQLWDALLRAGKEFEIQPCGLAARDTLRLEKAYSLYGNEINDNTTPIEAGLGWITKLNNECIAQEILSKQKEEGTQKALIGFEILQKAIPRKDYEIYNEKQEPIGIVTSGTMSPILQKGIGLGYVQTPFAQTNTPIFIKIREKLIEAKIVELPFV